MAYDAFSSLMWECNETGIWWGIRKEAQNKPYQRQVSLSMFFYFLFLNTKDWTLKLVFIYLFIKKDFVT